MKVTAYAILLFYVSLNISLYLVNQTQVLPYNVPAQRTPFNMAQALLGGFLTMTIASIAAVLVGNLLIGAAAGLSLFAIQYLIGQDTVIHWVFYGFPAFINDAALASGVDATTVTLFTTVTMALASLPWFWFIMSYFGGRSER